MLFSEAVYSNASTEGNIFYENFGTCHRSLKTLFITNVTYITRCPTLWSYLLIYFTSAQNTQLYHQHYAFFVTLTLLNKF